ncbi:MAG: twin-arginine translocase subunit TatC [Actinomycetota bacterium]|nr:twin-arginine translocase subunit TatC [Actinomycetota bacterium]
MPARVRPVSHEDRLSLVEHLDELRSRLIVSLVVFFAAFSVCYWQNDWLLHAVNRPLERAQHLNRDGTSSNKGGPLQEQATYARRVGDAAKLTGPALQGQRDVNRVLARKQKLSAPERTLLARQDRLLAKALAAEQAAAGAVPRNQERQPVTLGVTEPFVTTFTVAGYAALLLSLPFLLYQAYAFVLPAFSPAERKVALPVMAMVPVLFIAGCAFGYFVALPRAVDFLQNFNSQSFDILIRASDYYKFSVVLIALIGLLFQIPVGVLAVTRLGIISGRQLAKNRGYVILGLAIVAAVATPTPDPVTMLVAMAPLVVLFELSVLMARIFERRSDRAAAREAEDDDEDDDVDLEPWASGDPEGDRSLS